MRLDTLPSQPFASPGEHLEAEFRWLDARLADLIQRRRDQGRFDERPTRGLACDEGAVLAELAERPGQAWPPDRLRAIINGRVTAGRSPPLYAIAARCDLTGFERDVLLAVAACSFESRYQIAFAFAHNDMTRRLPTPGLLIELLGAGDRFAALACFAADSPLLALGMIRFDPGEAARPLADRSIGIDDRVLFALTAQLEEVDPQLANGLAIVVDVEEDWAPDLLDIPLPEASCLLFEGRPDLGQRALAARAAARSGLGLLWAGFEQLAAIEPDPAALARRLAREARISARALLVEVSDTAALGQAEALIDGLLGLGVRLFISAPPRTLDLGTLRQRDAIVRIAMPESHALDRLNWWRRALGDARAEQATRLAWTTRLGPHEIGRLRAVDPALLDPLARDRSRRRLPAVLQALPHRWDRDELLLPEAVDRQLAELTAFVAHWPKVIGEWGFGASNPQARHCLALFSGSSGTGKTMAAGIVAEAAQIDLYRANLATVFDKYIGETEKQIDRLFDAAADAGVALLFDEADVLFGNRTEVSDSHDRYANLTVAYLLQRVESHEGLVILASNLPGNMDEAFARRLTHTINFPLPDPALREQLWQRALPASAACEPDLDLRALAELFDLSGGSIRNAVLAAAYFAAADERPIGMRHLLRAIERELAKTGRSPIAADFGRLAQAR